jgi:hypothetical protein
MTDQECPFCPSPDYLEDFTKGQAKKTIVPIPTWRRQYRFWEQAIQKRIEEVATAETEQRGKFLRTVFDEDNFEERWRDFTVEVFGIETEGEPFLPRNPERVSIEPPGPFFFSSTSFPKLKEGDETPYYRQFFICRIKHKISDMSLVAHWWPTHGRLINLQSPLSPFPVNSDLNVIKDALSFFQTETRGAPAKFSEEVVSDVLRRLPTNATQKAAADELQVTERTLERWRARQGMSTWQEVVNRYSVADRNDG